MRPVDTDAFAGESHCDSSETLRSAARTIADLDDAETIASSHIAEAVQYRMTEVE